MLFSLGAFCFRPGMWALWVGISVPLMESFIGMTVTFVSDVQKSSLFLFLCLSNLRLWMYWNTRSILAYKQIHMV
jgi:hypothetical protein